MGGLITTLVAEREATAPPEDRRYHGGLLVGAALNVDRARAEPDAPVLTGTPAFPLLFLSNEGELGPVQAYAAKVSAAAKAEAARGEAGIVAPAVWPVERPGHGNVTWDERQRAVEHLLAWWQFGTFITQRSRGAAPSAGVRLRRDGYATVLAVNVHGGFTLDMQPDDLARLNLHPGGWFSLAAMDEDGGKSASVFYGRGSFHPMTEVGRGDLRARDHPEGYLCVDVADFGLTNAAAALGLAPRSHVRLSAAPPPVRRRLDPGRLLGLKLPAPPRPPAEP